MRLITFREAQALAFAKSSGTFQHVFEPMRPYIFSDSEFNTCIDKNPQVRQMIFRQSLMDTRIKNFSVHDRTRRPGKRPTVLVYNGANGFGDQIMTWPVTKILAEMGFEVHVWVGAGNNVCWWNTDWIASVKIGPMSLYEFELYDHHAIFESVTNADQHGDQLHPVDAMLKRVGINPEEIPASSKVVTPYFTPQEDHAAREFMEQNLGGAPMGIFQLSAAGKCRSFTPEKAGETLGAIARRTPGMAWIALVDKYVPHEYRLAAESMGLPNVKVLTFGSLRSLWAITRFANAVVAPDSMMVHVAGSMGVPCVGIWGPVDWAVRTTYYSNHHAIWWKEACPYAPCYHHGSSFPYFCPGGTEDREMCEIIAQVPVDHIADTVLEIVNNDQSTRDTDDYPSNGTEVTDAEPGEGPSIEAAGLLAGEQLPDLQNVGRGEGLGRIHLPAEDDFHGCSGTVPGSDASGSV